MKKELERKLANRLLTYSCHLKRGQSVFIEAGINAKSLVQELLFEADKLGIIALYKLKEEEVDRANILTMTREKVSLFSKIMKPIYENVDASIRIYGKNNEFNEADVPNDKTAIYMDEFFQKVFCEDVIDKKPWVLLSYPTSGMAQMAKMSTQAFEEYYYDVCTLDYAHMHAELENLKELMEKTDKVRLVGNGTDLTFSIKGMPAIICSGEKNLPDGEIYTAPVKDSVNGKISFNTPSTYLGKFVDCVTLNFKDGKIISECARVGERELTEILNTDAGARYIGEFAIGVNPYITKPMDDILFDEKMCKSIHFTPGDAYENADNGNRSSVHWDMVLLQSPEAGGGEMYFDDVLVRKNGMFVLPKLLGLNPENLKK